MIPCQGCKTRHAFLKISLRQVPPFTPANYLCAECAIEFINENRPRPIEMMPPAEVAAIREAVAAGRITFPPEITKNEDD